MNDGKSSVLSPQSSVTDNRQLTTENFFLGITRREWIEIGLIYLAGAVLMFTIYGLLVLATFAVGPTQ